MTESLNFLVIYLLSLLLLTQASILCIDLCCLNKSILPFLINESKLKLGNLRKKSSQIWASKTVFYGLLGREVLIRNSGILDVD